MPKMFEKKNMPYNKQVYTKICQALAKRAGRKVASIKPSTKLSLIHEQEWYGYIEGLMCEFALETMPDDWLATVENVGDLAGLFSTLVECKELGIDPDYAPLNLPVPVIKLLQEMRDGDGNSSVISEALVEHTHMVNASGRALCDLREVASVLISCLNVFIDNVNNMEKKGTKK
jgi:hypothetical protein